MKLIFDDGIQHIFFAHGNRGERVVRDVVGAIVDCRFEGGRFARRHAIGEKRGLLGQLTDWLIGRHQLLPLYYPLGVGKVGQIHLKVTDAIMQVVAGNQIVFQIFRTSAGEVVLEAAFHQIYLLAQIGQMSVVGKNGVHFGKHETRRAIGKKAHQTHKKRRYEKTKKQLFLNHVFCGYTFYFCFLKHRLPSAH